MAMKGTLTFSELQKLTGYKSSSGVERCLKRQGVPVLYGKNGPFTLVAALENALGLKADRDKIDPKYNFDF